MALDEGISSLIGRMYEGAHDAAAWDRIILDLKARMEACCVFVSISDLRHREMSRTVLYGIDSSVSADRLREYQEGFYLEDPTFQFACQNPNARFVDARQVIPADSYLDDPFIPFNRSMIGSTHWLVGYTAPDEDLTFGVSIHPPADIGPLPEDKARLFKMLFEHMDRALRLSARPPSLDGWREAVVLLDRYGRVRQASDAAQKLFALNDGISVCRGQLQGATCADTARLNCAIKAALSALEEGGYGGTAALPRPSGRRDLLVTVSPIPNPSSPFLALRPAALVRIVDPEGVAAKAPERWTGLFGFTPAEARLAAALLVGDHSLRDAADALGIAYWTARVHLKKLLEKTGTHSQSQLARLLTRLE